MSEKQMTAIVESALGELGLAESVLAAGQFLPRGHTGSMFTGGLVADDVVGGSLGVSLGAAAAGRLHDAASGLPGKMLVGVTASHVYGFAATTRHGPAGALVFRVARADIEVTVHPRVNVRVLELADVSSGSRIELEGSRIPLTHSRDVIEALE